jgi:excisionase family DNA binding protein
MESCGDSLKLLDVKQLSEQTGLPVSTIYKLVESEQIPFIRIAKGKKKGKVYFRKEGILAWLSAQENAPRGEVKLRL